MLEVAFWLQTQGSASGSSKGAAKACPRSQNRSQSEGFDQRGFLLGPIHLRNSGPVSWGSAQSCIEFACSPFESRLPSHQDLGSHQLSQALSSCALHASAGQAMDAMHGLSAALCRAGWPPQPEKAGSHSARRARLLCWGVARCLMPACPCWSTKPLAHEQPLAHQCI